jgi:hypothetical protein
MRSSLDHGMFWVFFLSLCIAGSVVGGRYNMYREVMCLEKVSPCPWDLKWSGSDHGTAVSSQCVKIRDNNGVESWGNLEVSSPRLNTPSRCWTNGFDVTLTDPKLVMIVVLSILGFLIVLYYALLRHFLNPLFFKSYTDHSENYLGTFSALIAIVCIGGIISLIVAAVYNTQYSQVTCTTYQPCLYRGRDGKTYTHNWTGCVQIDDGTTVTNNLELEMGTIQFDLPAACWSNGTKITMYNPLHLLYSFLVAIGTILVIITFMVCTRPKEGDKMYQVPDPTSVQGTVQGSSQVINPSSTTVVEMV